MIHALRCTYQHTCKGEIRSNLHTFKPPASNFHRGVKARKICPWGPGALASAIGIRNAGPWLLIPSFLFSFGFGWIEEPRAGFGLPMGEPLRRLCVSQLFFFLPVFAHFVSFALLWGRRAGWKQRRGRREREIWHFSAIRSVSVFCFVFSSFFVSKELRREVGQDRRWVLFDSDYSCGDGASFVIILYCKLVSLPMEKPVFALWNRDTTNSFFLQASSIYPFIPSPAQISDLLPQMG